MHDQAQDDRRTKIAIKTKQQSLGITDDDDDVHDHNEIIRKR